MRKIAVADSETDPFKIGRIPAPFIWGIYDGETFEYFRETWEFIEFIKDRDWIVYAHNGGKFDFFFLAEFIDLLEPLTVINGRITKFKIGNCEFRDSYAILPIPLAAHDKGTIDYSLFEAEVREEHMPEIIDYLYRDCYSLYSLVTHYIDAYGLNLTLASGALKTWSRICKETPPDTTASFYESFKPFYYGGRVECFQKGLIEKPFKVADINSAYPFAMLSNHPSGAVFTESNELPISKEETQRAFIRLRAKSLGAFPYRNDKGALEFPSDGEYREFFVTGWEFDAARDTGNLVIDDVYSVFTFADKMCFTDYVLHFYEMKQAAKKGSPDYIIAKLHLNSLYGKFGANPANYEEFKTCHPSDIAAMEELYGYEFCDFFGPHAIVCRPISDAAMRYYNVATAASVTGFVRAYLFRAMSQCNGLLYCDTDSIAAHGLDNLKLGRELGQWDIEANCDHGGIAGKKLYAFHDAQKDTWKCASKGVRFSQNEIMRVCSGETVTYANPVPTFSLKSAAKFIDREVKIT